MPQWSSDITITRPVEGPLLVVRDETVLGNELRLEIPGVHKHTEDVIDHFARSNRIGTKPRTLAKIQWFAVRVVNDF